MEKCKDCGAPVAEGEEYCESCLLLRDLGLTDVGDQDEDQFLKDIEGLLASDENGFDAQEDSNLSEDLNIDDDFLSLIEGMSSGEEPEYSEQSEPEEEIFALDDNSEEEEKPISKSSDVGDILSDALGVLNDPAMDAMEKELFDLMPNVDEAEAPKEDEKAKKADKKSAKKDKKTDKKLSKKAKKNVANEAEADGEKKGFFKKVFENVPGPEPDPDAPTEEQIAAEKKAQKLAKKEEKKKAQTEKKAKKKATKAEKNKQKSAIRQMKAEEKRRRREEEAREAALDTSRINKVGASLVLSIAAALTIFVIVGTNTFTYAQDVSSAEEYFSKKQYTKAYNKIAGMDVKEKDEPIYNKIVTVMYVNKQYNSYENYYNMEMYPEALNSLVKGLKRYDKYSDQAKELDITEDMDYVKSNIVGALDTSFHLSESDVQYLMNMDTQEKYSEEINRLSKEN